MCCLLAVAVYVAFVGCCDLLYAVLCALVAGRCVCLLLLGCCLQWFVVPCGWLLLLFVCYGVLLVGCCLFGEC